jgi:hypothetical protein
MNEPLLVKTKVAFPIDITTQVPADVYNRVKMGDPEEVIAIQTLAGNIALNTIKNEGIRDDDVVVIFKEPKFDETN